jgi:hypothetical protein
MSQRSTHNADALTSHVVRPASDVVVTRPEQGRGHAGAPSTHFDEAQAKQALW